MHKKVVIIKKKRAKERIAKKMCKVPKKNSHGIIQMNDFSGNSHWVIKIMNALKLFHHFHFTNAQTTFTKMQTEFRKCWKKVSAVCVFLCSFNIYLNLHEFSTFKNVFICSVSNNLFEWKMKNGPNKRKSNVNIKKAVCGTTTHTNTKIDMVFERIM